MCLKIIFHNFITMLFVLNGVICYKHFHAISKKNSAKKGEKFHFFSTNNLGKIMMFNIIILMMFNRVMRLNNFNILKSRCTNFRELFFLHNMLLYEYVYSLLYIQLYASTKVQKLFVVNIKIILRTP